MARVFWTPFGFLRHAGPLENTRGLQRGRGACGERAGPPESTRGLRRAGGASGEWVGPQESTRGLRRVGGASGEWAGPSESGRGLRRAGARSRTRGTRRGCLRRSMLPGRHAVWGAGRRPSSAGRLQPGRRGAVSTAGNGHQCARLQGPRGAPAVLPDALPSWDSNRLFPEESGILSTRSPKILKLAALERGPQVKDKEGVWSRLKPSLPPKHRDGDGTNELAGPHARPTFPALRE